MIPILAIILSTGIILLSLFYDAKYDVDQFKRNLRINHGTNFLAWFVPTIILIGCVHLVVVWIGGYSVNLLWWQLICMWMLQYVSMRYLLFDKWLNIMRDLPADYSTKDRTKNAAWVDRNIPTPVFSFKRIAAVIISSYFLLMTIVDYYEIWHPSMPQHVGIVIITAMAIFGLVYSWKFFKET